MKLRTRKARFSAIVNNTQWKFVWEPKASCLIAWKSHSRKNKIRLVTASELVEMVSGQKMLL